MLKIDKDIALAMTMDMLLAGIETVLVQLLLFTVRHKNIVI